MACGFSPAHAYEDLPLPRFVSIKSAEANMRTGPGKRYPIKWLITRKNLPVEITSEFEQWRKIRDMAGDEGWIHQSMLSSSRFGIIQTGPVTLHRTDSVSSRPVAKLDTGVIAKLKACEKDWCEVEVGEISGWTPRGELWGIYPQEVLK